MQASLDSTGLKHLTRALTCMSKFGDDVTLVATSDKLMLSTTNSSMSAFCRFKFDRDFFSRYKCTNEPLQPLDDDMRVMGQLLTKNLLSILKHRTVEKSVDRCELSLVDGAARTQDENQNTNTPSTSTDQDSLESKLIVRLHCKHGDFTCSEDSQTLVEQRKHDRGANCPRRFNESRVTVTPRAVRDMLEHFPISRGPKSDPQLVWSFAEEEVYMKGLESSLDANGTARPAFH
ncbi:hypothetical protein NM688_g4080 [Phlebia brevispora]|uniref:Uncharacterized protein n=1 Tax=Phlebia brevispora TaxID=194682 RepID=A0ACC1T3N1_9APHY|nr:hypothetical protein NM688_g4080 [Phlebia brevispora]